MSAQQVGCSQVKKLEKLDGDIKKLNEAVAENIIHYKNLEDNIVNLDTNLTRPSKDWKMEEKLNEGLKEMENYKQEREKEKTNKSKEKKEKEAKKERRDLEN